MGWSKRKRRERKKGVFPSLGKIILGGLVVFLVVAGVRSVLGSVWGKGSSLNIVWGDGSPMILGVNPVEGSLTLLTLRKDDLVETVGGHGFYPVGSVHNLGKLVGRGEGFLADSLQAYLAIPIDGWLIKSAKESTSGASLARMKRDLLVSLVGAQKTFISNLSVFDRARLWWFLAQLRSDRLMIIKLPGVEGKNLPQFEKLLQENFSYPDLIKEEKTVAVLNGTATFGLASKAAHLVRNMGLRVIWVGEGEPLSDHCLVAVKDHPSSASALRIKKVFKCEKIQTLKGEARADITLTLGEAYNQYLSGP